MHDRPTEASEGPILIYHSRLGIYRSFSSQISPDQGERLLPKSNYVGKRPEELLTRNPSTV